MIELKTSDGFQLSHVIRGPQVYMAPKGDERLLIGATSEEMGFDTTVTAGGLYKLLEDGWRIVPGIYDLEVTDTWAGLRPAAPDNAPLAGRTPWHGVIFATGHFRHGILHAPVAAQDIARLVVSGEATEWLELSDPRRFLNPNALFSHTEKPLS
jgi:glycine oxidase